MRIFLAALPLALIATVGIAQPTETIVYETLGFKVNKPAGWHTLSAEANAENLQRAFGQGTDLQQAIARNANVPLVAFTKFAEPYPDLNPSFKMNVRPLGALEGKSAREILALILPTLSQAFPDAKIDQQPMDTVIDGQPAGYARVIYTLKVGTDQFPTASELWIVPRKSHLFIIGAGTRQDERTGTRAEIQSIISTIRIDAQR